MKTSHDATGSQSILAGQQAVTASAVALASNLCIEVTVKANFNNGIPVYVGPSTVTTSTGFELYPGEALTIQVQNTNLLYVIASTTGAGVSWAARK